MEQETHLGQRVDLEGEEQHKTLGGSYSHTQEYS